MRAISPVIATVIIVSVAIAISIMVAIWLTSIATNVGNQGDLRIISTNAPPDKDVNGVTYWNVTITVRNVGTKSLTIQSITINPGGPANLNNVYYSIGGGPLQRFPSDGLLLNPGDEAKIVFYLSSNGQAINISGTIYEPAVNYEFSTGQQVNIEFQTDAGSRNTIITL